MVGLPVNPCCFSCTQEVVQALQSCSAGPPVPWQLLAEI